MKYNPYENYKDSNIKWLGMVPKSWSICKLKFAANILSSKVDKNIRDEEIPVKLCNYIDVYHNNIINNKINFMEGSASKKEIDKFSLHIGDVLITKDSESWKDIAKPALVCENIKHLICGYHLALIRPSIDIMLGEYLFHCLTSDVYNYQFQISANGVTRYGLQKHSIDNAYIAYPSLEDQYKICNYIKKQDLRILNIIEILGGKESSKTASKNSMIGKLLIYKKSLINHIMTGAINVL